MIRKNKADYFAYALLDAIIDGFFPVLENYGERIEELKEEVVANPTHQTLNLSISARITSTASCYLASTRCD